MGTTKPRRVSAVLALPRQVRRVGAYVQSIVAAMTGNASFPKGDWSQVVTLLVT